ncbi:MAG: nucleoside monophosphate kinase [Candidatus Magasanikbacteria bacterium]|nr:nucleoside monophosphate kinase [Candidatus Magasanikbacteria bacterium]
MKKIIILLGIPGSGKGTQAKLIAENYSYTHISTGNLFRAILADENADGKIVKAVEGIKDGKMVADEIVYKLAFAEIEKKMNESDGVVLDGAIRNLEQAEAYDRFFKEKGWQNDIMAVEIELTDEIATERLLKRHEGREDDKKDVILKRMEDQGNAKIRPIVNYYKKIDILKVVDGSKNIEEVTKSINKVLK